MGGQQQPERIPETSERYRRFIGQNLENNFEIIEVDGIRNIETVTDCWTIINRPLPYLKICVVNQSPQFIIKSIEVFK